MSEKKHVEKCNKKNHNKGAKRNMRSATQKRNDNKEDKRNRKFLPESLLPGASGVVASKVVEALIEPELLHRGGRGRGGDTQSTKSGSLGRDDKRGTRRTSSQHAHKQTTRKQHHLREKKVNLTKKSTGKDETPHATIECTKTTGAV